MLRIKSVIKIVGIIWVIISQNSCINNTPFVELKNGNIRSPSGKEYTFLANEGFIETFGNSTFLGKIRWEYPILNHLGGSWKTGMYSCDGSNFEILYRIKPFNEWRTFYRKAFLPKLEIIPENCIRFEFIHNKEISRYEGNYNFSPEKWHMTCNEGIIDFDEIHLFLNDVKKGKSPQEEGLYEMITMENGMLENCYLMGTVYGYFKDEFNLAISYSVWSFNDIGYSIRTDFGHHVISIDWLEKLGYKKQNNGAYL